MRNVLVIFKKEMKSYFASPIAYLLLTIFAVIFGFFFYTFTRLFVLQGMQMQMMGRGMPMDVNEQVIRPLLSNASVLGLFLIPMITMRLYAEEKRSGTMELLMTSPVRDFEIILGKFLAALRGSNNQFIIVAENIMFMHGNGKRSIPGQVEV